MGQRWSHRGVLVVDGIEPAEAVGFGLSVGVLHQKPLVFFLGQIQFDSASGCDLVLNSIGSVVSFGSLLLSSWRSDGLSLYGGFRCET